MPMETETLETETKETSVDYSAGFLKLHEDLQTLQASVDGIQKLLGDYLPEITEQGNTDTPIALFQEINEKLQTLAVPEEPEVIGDEAGFQEETPAETERETETQVETETEQPEIESKTETLPEKDTAGSAGAEVSGQEMMEELKKLNQHLETMETTQQNLMNIQVPIMCGVGLIFGSLLAVVFSRYLKT